MRFRNYSRESEILYEVYKNFYYIKKKKREQRLNYREFVTELQTTLARISAKGFDERIKDERTLQGKKRKKREKSFAKRVNEKRGEKKGMNKNK